MSIWMKVVTAIRGGVNEAGEAIADNQALRILDQEIRDADSELKRSKDALADIMAKQKLGQKKVDGLAAKIKEYEGYVLQALAKNDEALAAEVAAKIAEFEQQMESEQALVTGFADSVAQLRKAVGHSEGNLRRLKQQVDIVKATESVQKAQMAVSQRHGGANTKMRTALDSLDRIKQQQEARSARMEAANELANDGDGAEASLDQKLKAAGIAGSTTSGADILARLKAKQG